MRIKITADSTCDLSEELLAQWDIALMPMHILMGEDSYLDGVTIHPADVFAYVNAGGKMPKSAAANLVEYTEFFEPFAKECDAVIHISVSSKLSSCFQNAKLAAGEFENVYVVDSQNICTGQGYLVLKAAKWAADGLPPRNITMRLQSLAKRVELSFVLDRLDFMAKSGRCSGVLAFGANLLGIKPALEVIDGELKVVKKYRGSLPICVGKYITDRLVERDDIEDSLVFISSCQPKPGCMDAVKIVFAAGILVVDSDNRDLKGTCMRIANQRKLGTILICRAVSFSLLDLVQRKDDFRCLTGKCRCLQRHGCAIALLREVHQHLFLDGRVRVVHDLVVLSLIIGHGEIKLLLNQRQGLLRKKLR